MISSNINVLDWPPKGPDINIAEDVWKLLSDAVYDGPPYENNAVLFEKINNVIADINQSKRNVIQNLYANIRSRVCKVLLKRRNYQSITIFLCFVQLPKYMSFFTLMIFTNLQS